MIRQTRAMTDRTTRLALIALAGLSLLAGPAAAQPRPDPDWPCV